MVQQPLLVTFYHVLLFLLFASVDFRANCKCYNGEHRNPFKHMLACLHFHSAKFFTFEMRSNLLWLLKVLS